MSDVAPPAKAARGRGWMVAAGVILVVFILGAAAGVFAAGRLSPKAAEHKAAEEHAAEAEDHGTRLELDVGRITVIIPSDHKDGGNLHLLITPLVVGKSSAEAAEGGHGGKEEAPAGPVPELRDAFIEYLSQLQEFEVRGSLGLTTMRAELLRRARAVAPDLNASAVLIQEFVIQ